MSFGAPDLRMDVARPGDLSAAEIDRWRTMQAANAALASPFFAPEFVCAAAQLDRGVEVTVLQDGGQTVGYFPFQRSGRSGRPVGGRLSDCHGVIAPATQAWQASALIRGSRLRSWSFRCVPAAQTPFARFGRARSVSPVIDLSHGLDAYLRGRRDAGSATIAQIQRKRRKLEREHGAIRFAWHSTAAAPFEQLMTWKSEQRRRTRAHDPCEQASNVDLLRLLAQTDTRSFGGVLSTLHVGDQLVSVHLGLSYGATLHWWFPSYNPAFADYSPGMILLLALVEQAATRGFQRIDLGPGDERYKASMTAVGHTLMEGWIATNPIAHAVHRVSFGVKQMSRWQLLSGPAKAGKRLLRQVKRRAGRPGRPGGTGARDGE